MSVYVNHFSGLLAYVFSVDGRLISKYPIALLFLAAVFMYQGCRTLGVRRQAAFAAALTYASTPFFFDSYVTGYLSLFIGLALFPKAFITVHEAFDKPPGFRRFLKGFVWIGLSASTIHMAFLVTAVLGGYAVLRMAVGPGLIRTRMRSVLSVLGMSLGIALLHPPVATLIHGLLFVPGTREELTALAQSHAVTWIHAVAPTFFQSVSQIGPPYNYEQAALAMISGASPIFMIGRALLVGLGIAAVAVARGRARLWAAFFAFVFIGFSLLGKGISEPLSISGFWLRELPGAEVFRNVRYFTVPAAMALAFLVGLSVHAWITSRSRLRPWASAGLGAVLIASSLGFWSGDLLDQLTPYDVAETTLEAHDRIRAMPDDSRLLNLPMSGPAVYLSDTGRLSATGDNPFVTWPAKPSIWVSPQPATFPQYFSALYHSMLDPARYPVRALLNFGRVGYVLFDPHWQTRYASFIVTNSEPWLSGYETPDRLTLALEQQTGLVDDSTLSQGPVRVARVEAVLGQRLSVPDRVALSSPSLRHLTTASFAFPSDRQITHLQGPYRRSPSANALASEIWLDADPLDADPLDPVIFFVPPQHIFEPGVQMGQNSSDATQEWVATYLNAWWYLNSEISDATSSILTKAPNSSARMSLITESGPHELWIRHFVSPDGSALAVKLDDNVLGSIPTTAADVYGYVWTQLPLPPLPAGEHVLQLATTAAGLNAVSQVVLAPQNVMRMARDQANRSIANLPLGLVLPDLEQTDGKRRFSLPVAGLFRLDTLVPDDFAAALSIDGVPVTATESDSPVPGKKRLQVQIQLEAGSHILTVASASTDSPVTVEAVTSFYHSGDADSGCASATCSGAVRYLATANADGRTITFTGRLRAGKNQALVQSFQVEPDVLYSNTVHLRGQGIENVRVAVRLDPGSSQARLDVRQRLGSNAGLDFELLAVEESALPHGISITLSRGQPRSASEATIRPTGDGSPTRVAGVYEGLRNRTLVRLDEKFDHRWSLTVDGAKVDPSAHTMLDGHFNGWVVDLSPGSTIEAEFTVQNAYFAIQIANLALLFFAVLAGWQPWHLLRRSSTIISSEARSLRE